MTSRRTWPIGLLAMLMAALLTVSELKGAPRLTVQNPTALYLLAEYKLAVGDAASGVELLDRALAAGRPVAALPNALSACNISSAVVTP